MANISSELTSQILTWLFSFPSDENILIYVKKIKNEKVAIVEYTTNLGVNQLLSEKNLILANLGLQSWGVSLSEFEQFQILQSSVSLESTESEEINIKYPIFITLNESLHSEILQYINKWKFLAKFSSSSLFLDEIPYLHSLVSLKISGDDISSLQSMCEKRLSTPNDGSEANRVLLDEFRTSLQNVGILPEQLVSELINHPYGEKSILIGILLDVSTCLLNKSSESELNIFDESLAMMLQLRHLRDMLANAEVLRRLFIGTKGQKMLNWLRSISQFDLLLTGDTLKYLAEYTLKLSADGLNQFSRYVYRFFGSSDEFTIALGDVSGEYVFRMLSKMTTSSEKKEFKAEIINQSQDKPLCIVALQLIDFIIEHIPTYTYVRS